MEQLIDFIKRWLIRRSHDLSGEVSRTRVGPKTIAALESELVKWGLAGSDGQEWVKGRIEDDIQNWLRSLSGDPEVESSELRESRKAVAFIQLLCSRRKITQDSTINGRLGPRTLEAFASLEAFEETAIELVQLRLKEKFYDLGEEAELRRLGKETKRALEEETRREETINPTFEFEHKVVAFVQLLCRKYGFHEVGGIDGSLGPKTREALAGLERRIKYGPRIGLALSGGGFRASIFHLGVIRRLEELGIMPHVNVISSVSGGSIVAAFYAIEMERRLRARLARLARIEDLEVMDLKVLTVDDAGKIPNKGKSLVIIARVNDQLHFCIFDSQGQKVRDRSETQLSHRPEELAALKSALEGKWDHPQLSESESAELVKFVTAILGGRVDRKTLRQQRLEIFDEIARRFFVATDHNLRVRALVFAPFFHPLATLKLFHANYTRANLIQAEYDRWLYRGNTLDELPHVGDKSADSEDAASVFGPKIVLNTTSLLTGERIPFSREAMSDMRQLSTVNTNVLGLSQIVGASAGVPGLFPPTPVSGDLLVDGGVSDNQGLEGLWREHCDVLLVSDASGQMEQVHKLKSKAIAVLSRTNTIFQFQIREQLLRRLRKWLGSAPPEWEREFAFVHLFLSLKDRPAAPQVPSEFVPALGRIRTDLDQFNYVEREALMYHGYTLIDSQIKHHCPRLLKRILEGEGLESSDIEPVVPLLFDESRAWKESKERKEWWRRDKKGEEEAREDSEEEDDEESEIRWITDRRSNIKKVLEVGSYSLLIMRSLKRYGWRAGIVLAIGGVLPFLAFFRFFYDRLHEWTYWFLNRVIAERFDKIVPEWIFESVGEYAQWPITLRGFAAIAIFLIVGYFLTFVTFLAMRWLSRLWNLQVYLKLTDDLPRNAWKRRSPPNDG